MKVFFAGVESQLDICKRVKPKNILFSFYNAKQEVVDYAKKCECFLLDSGAFSIMRSRPNINFDEYTEKYIDFINTNGIDLFFEMDIDNIVGLKKVEELRNRIERKTGKQVIPVFHRNRGKQYFVDMCKNYKYVALGGMAGGLETTEADYKYFPWFIETAHKYGAKIHGLGFTHFKYLIDKRYCFDTVDSTSWLYGAKVGRIYTVRDGYPKQIDLRKDGFRANGAKVAEHNMKLFERWVETL